LKSGPRRKILPAFAARMRRLSLAAAVPKGPAGTTDHPLYRVPGGSGLSSRLATISRSARAKLVRPLDAARNSTPRLSERASRSFEQHCGSAAQTRIEIFRRDRSSRTSRAGDLSVPVGEFAVD